MIYNCLMNEEYNTIDKRLKKHKAYAILFLACALLIIILMFLIVNRTNINYLIPVFTILFTLSVSLVLLINFIFIKVEKDYLKLLKKAKENHNQIIVGKLTNEYKNDKSVYSKIKCFNLSIEHDEKISILFLEQTDAPNLQINETYKFTIYRHFILKIENINNEIKNH